MSASSSGATSALCSATTSNGGCNYALMFSNNKLHLLNLATKEKEFETTVTIHDNSSDSFLTTRAFLPTDSSAFIAALKKVTDVYAGEFSGTTSSKGSILGINLSAQKIETPGDFLCVSYDGSRDGSFTTYGNEVSCIGTVQSGGRSFLRRCVEYTVDASATTKPIILASKKDGVEELKIRGLQTSTDITLHGFARVRLINSVVRNVFFISNISGTKYPGTVVLEGMSKVLGPDKNVTIVRAGSSCLPTIAKTA